MASRPADVSPEVWLLAIALTSLVPAAIYVGMTWRVLHKMKNGTRETDQAVAVVAALSVKNAATIENFMTLLDGLENHPSIGELRKRQEHATNPCLMFQHPLERKAARFVHSFVDDETQCQSSKWHCMSSLTIMASSSPLAENPELPNIHTERMLSWPFKTV